MKRRQLLKTLSALGLGALVEQLWPKSARANPGVKVGYGTGYWDSADAVNHTYDVSIVNKDGNGFTPAAGQYFMLVFGTGQSSATNASAMDNQELSIGMVVSNANRRCVFMRSELGSAVSNYSSSGMYNDCVLACHQAAAGNAAVLMSRLDFDSVQTNAMRFIVDQTPGSGAPYNTRFNVLVIDGLADVALFDITCPTGNPISPSSQAISGIGVDHADLFLFMQAAAPTAYPATVTGGRVFFGAAKSSGEQFVVGTHSQNGVTPSVTRQYNSTAACIAGLSGTGTVSARAAFVSSDADGLTINWSGGGVGNSLIVGAALKGLDCTVKKGLTVSADTSTTIPITGLSYPCIGGIVASTCEVESTPPTSAAPGHLSLGAFVSTANRGAQGIKDLDTVAYTVQHVATGVLYDEVYINIADAGTSNDGAMDLVSLDSGGATFVMDDADPAQKAFYTVLIADTSAPPPSPKLRSLVGVGQ